MGEYPISILTNHIALFAKKWGFGKYRKISFHDSGNGEIGNINLTDYLVTPIVCSWRTSMSSYINKVDSMIGSKDDVATKFHFMSRLQQRDAMASDSRRNQVRTTTKISN